jgi:biotin carboxyl carrier protein
MKLEEIKKIMELLNEQGFSEISLEQKDFKLQLKKQGAVITTVQASPQVQASATNAKNDASPTPVIESQPKRRFLRQ